MYVRGNALGFSWKKGVKLNRTETGTWQALVTYQSAVDGFRCQFCVDNTSFGGTFFQYRVFVDDTIDMLGGNLHLKIPISKSSTYFSDTPEYFAYPWYFSKAGSAATFPVESYHLGRSYNIVIIKPPSFHENPFKRYPTLIVFDLSEEIYNSSAHLINNPTVEAGTVGEYVLVGFGDYLSQRDRLDLLTQVKGNFRFCINGTFEDNCDGCIPEGITNVTEYIWYMANKCGKFINVGGKGNDTLNFLQDTVIPLAKQVTNMRIETDQPNLGIMGMSAGGLMACHAAWTRPDVFGYAACQSPSFWWPGYNDTYNEFFFNNVSLKNPNLRTKRPYQRIYLDVGGVEGDMMIHGMLSAAQDMSMTRAFEWNKNLWVHVFPGMPHTSTHWLMRLWDPLKIFFPTTPGPILDDISECTTASGFSSVTSLNLVILAFLCVCVTSLLQL